MAFEKTGKTFKIRSNRIFFGAKKCTSHTEADPRSKFPWIFRIKKIKDHSPWFFSDNKDLVAGKNISINSGTFRIIRNAHRAAFLRIYAFCDFSSRSTSDARSRDISGEAIAPKVHNAKPTINWVGLFKSL